MGERFVPGNANRAEDAASSLYVKNSGHRSVVEPGGTRPFLNLVSFICYLLRANGF